MASPIVSTTVGVVSASYFRNRRVVDSIDRHRISFTPDRNRFTVSPALTILLLAAPSGDLTFKDRGRCVGIFRATKSEIIWSRPIRGFLMRFRFTSFLLPLFTAACAVQEPAPQSPPFPPPTDSQPETKPEPVAAIAAAPRKKKPGPIATRPMNVKTDCSFRDESGYSGRMKLSVEHAKVHSFQATVTIPRRGNCRFDLKNFRQTRELPTVQLTHLRDPCVVQVWEQEERVTVAFQQCQKMCSGNAWEGLWPILADRRDGSCA